MMFAWTSKTISTTSLSNIVPVSCPMAIVGDQSRFTSRSDLSSRYCFTISDCVLLSPRTRSEDVDAASVNVVIVCTLLLWWRFWGTDDVPDCATVDDRVDINDSWIVTVSEVPFGWDKLINLSLQIEVKISAYGTVVVHKASESTKG